METFQVLKFDVSIKDEILAKQKDADMLRRYLYDVVAPIICEAIVTLPKGGEVGGRVSCDTRGDCRVEVGGSLRF